MAGDDRHEIARKEDQTGSTLAWFLTGAAIGATVAILYTPKSGKETRQYLGDKAQAGRDAVENASQDVMEASRDMFERGRRLVEDAADLFDRGKRLVKG